MSRADDYKSHLQSTAWAELREIAMQRSRGVCETCRALPATQVHHVRYPKRFAEDHPDNVLALCDRCHELNHGIRGDTMNLPAPLETYETVTFTFEGRGRTYDFELFLVDGVPLIAVEDVQARLTEEDARAGRPSPLNGGNRSLERFLELRAAALDVRYKRHDQRGRLLVTCSGMMQVLMQSESSSGQAFREQLGDWLERGVVEGHEKMKAMAVSGGVASTALAMFKQMLAVAEEQAAQIAQADHKSTTALQMSQTAVEGVQRLERIVNDNRQLLAKFLAARGVAIEPKTFAKYMTDKLKASGGYQQKNVGWFTVDGVQISQHVQAPGTMYSHLNAWDTKFLETALKNFEAEESAAW